MQDFVHQQYVQTQPDGLHKPSRKLKPLHNLGCAKPFFFGSDPGTGHMGFWVRAFGFWVQAQGLGIWSVRPRRVLALNPKLDFDKPYMYQWTPIHHHYIVLGMQSTTILPNKNPALRTSRKRTRTPLISSASCETVRNRGGELQESVLKVKYYEVLLAFF